MAPSKRPALGRGLDALLGGDVPEPAAGVSIVEIDPRLIRPMPGQPRRRFDDAALDELADSIRAQGILQPVVVRREDDGAGTAYELVIGERRWRAALRAGLTAVPAMVRELTPASAFAQALVENLQREDLSAVETAASYRRLIDEYGFTHERLGVAVGKSRAAITNTLRLLSLPDDVQTAVLEGRLSFGHARALAALSDADVQSRLAADIERTGASVRETEAIVAELQRPSAPAPAAVPRKPVDPAVRRVADALRARFGAPVRLTWSAAAKRGTIVIPYAGLDDLDRLLKAFGIAEP